MINSSATDALCTCCSLKHEDQDHMFQYQCKQTRDATKPGIVITETTFHRDNILPAVTKNTNTNANSVRASPQGVFLPYEKKGKMPKDNSFSEVSCSPNKRNMTSL